VVNYIVRRLIGAVLMLFVVSVCTFSIFFVVPRLAGDSPQTLAARYVGKTANEAQVEAAAVRLGFTDPIPVQYAHWVKAVFVGADYDYGPGVERCHAPCFGYSFITNQPVWDDLMDRLPVTLSLAVGASIIWLLGGVAVGVVSAIRRGTVFDRAAMGVALGGVSLPIYFTALLSLAVFSYQLGWTAPGASYTPFFSDPLTWAYDLILPWITLALLFSAAYARLTRAGMLETMGEDYVRTARAKGLRERRVIVRHGLRGALTPIITIFGLDVGLLLGGAIFTESAYSLPGLGKFAIDAIDNFDIPRVMGVTMLASFFIVIANLVVDLLYAVVDPRVRLA
jgi:peptide/nickel transport system permease protein